MQFNGLRYYIKQTYSENLEKYLIRRSLRQRCDYLQISHINFINSSVNNFQISSNRTDRKREEKTFAVRNLLADRKDTCPLVVP